MNSKNTKRSLLTSVLSLAVCGSMLVGTTFAWFTDSVSSTNNVITTGNLDVELYYKTKLDDKWLPVEENTQIFDETTLWEPGYTKVVYFKVANEGSLALKYNMNINVNEEKAGVNKAGDEFLLSDILNVGYVEFAENFGVSAEEMMETTVNHTFKNSRDKFAEFAAGEGSFAIYECGGFNLYEFATPEKHLQKGESNVGVMAVSMPKTVGNEANHNGVDVPYIDFGINVVATQASAEADSFGNDYDKDAPLPVINVVNKPFISNYTATEDYTINGGGQTINGVATSADVFTWIDGKIPEMSNIFSSANGAKVTVNDLTFTGTMSSVMAGNYVDTNNDWFNTEFNNVNIIDAEVVSFSSNISPALCVYGTAVLNDCTITGTTLSELDTDPMWPVYDMAVVNYSNTTLKNTKVGSIFVWNQAELIVAEGSEVDTIVIRGDANTNNNYQVVTVEAGATVKAIDLSAISDTNKVMITVEDGATFGGFVDDDFADVTFATVDAWRAARNGATASNSDELNTALAKGGNVVLTADIAAKETTFTVPAGKNVTLYMNGNTISGTFDNTSNTSKNLFEIKGTLTIDGEGLITMNTTGIDMGWNAMSCTLFVNGGDLTVENTTVKNEGGTSMAYAIDTNPWNPSSNAVLDVVLNNVTVESTYRGIRVRDNGPYLVKLVATDSNIDEIWYQEYGENYGKLVEVVLTNTTADTSRVNTDVLEINNTNE